MNSSSASFFICSTETGGTKRKGSSRPGLPAKKPRKKAEVLDENTMVALALSSSLYEQETDSERALQTGTAAPQVSMTPALKWASDAGISTCVFRGEGVSVLQMPHLFSPLVFVGKGRGKKKKGGVPRPPPLLLVQNAEAALNRLQERVSALLLRNRPPSPPTPTRCPSSLTGCSGAAPLWRKSSLLDGDATRLSDLYTHQLRGFFTLSQATTVRRVVQNRFQGYYSIYILKVITQFVVVYQ